MCMGSGMVITTVGVWVSRWFIITLGVWVRMTSVCWFVMSINSMSRAKFNSSYMIKCIEKIKINLFKAILWELTKI